MMEVPRRNQCAEIPPMHCGFFAYRPKHLQRFNCMRSFMGFFTTLLVVYGELPTCNLTLAFPLYSLAAQTGPLVFIYSLSLHFLTRPSEMEPNDVARSFIFVKKQDNYIALHGTARRPHDIID